MAGIGSSAKKVKKIQRVLKNYDVDKKRVYIVNSGFDSKSNLIPFGFHSQERDEINKLFYNPATDSFYLM